MRKNIFLLLFLSSLISCEKKESTDIEPIVDRDLIKFEKNEIPSGLQSAFDNNRIIIFGETHYVQEHQEYLSYLIENISNKDFVFLFELSACVNWMVEEYTNGGINSMYKGWNSVDRICIEKTREVNLNEDYDFNVQYLRMDVNYHKKNFLSSLIESEKIFGNQNDFDSIKSLIPESEEYADELHSLQNKFKTNETYYIQKFGETWYSRYVQMIDSEIISMNYRLSGDNSIREKFMADFILSVAEKNPSKKIIINCGMCHAQKHTLMGSGNKVGYYINEKFPDSTYSIAFVGIKGEILFSTETGNDLVLFNLLAETANNDLIRIIGNKAAYN